MSIDVCSSYKAITPEEERILVAQAKAGNTKAARILVNSIMPLIVGLAHSMPKGSLSAEDLIAEGVIGAYKAIDKFTMTAENRWSTYAMLNEKYAVGWVKQKMQQALHHAHVVTCSTKDRIAGNFNSFISYDAPIENSNGNSESKMTLADVLADENAPDPTATVPVTELEIQEVIAQIDDADLRNLMTLFASGMTSREVGKHFGISHQQAINRQNKAIETLQYSIKV